MYENLSSYITNINSNVFCLKGLPEEVISVLFAYYSRSSSSLKENLNKLINDGDLVVTKYFENKDTEELLNAQKKAQEFHSKWTVGYGHSSVAEHSVVHIALEDISIVASKVIEDARLASYTEKSTRYVEFDTSKMVSAKNLGIGDLEGVYQDATQSLMKSYIEWQDPFVQIIKENTPKKEKQTEKGYLSSCRSTALDSLRYLLPAATYTNIGMTVNARTLESILVKMNSHYLLEIRELAAKIKAEAQKIIPTLLKYTDANEFLEEEYLRPFIGNTPDDFRTKNEVVLLEPYHSEEDALKLICAPYAVKKDILQYLLANMGKRDKFSRVFERTSLTFVMYMDFGAYRDVQRHRMATLVMEPFEPIYGYEVPRGIKELGYYDKYCALMEKAHEAYTSLDDNGWNYEAQYVLPLAYRVKVTATMNLRELQHFIELRTSRQGHYSYRDIAHQVYKIVEEKYPTIAQFIRCNMEDYALTRDEK